MVDEAAGRYMVTREMIQARFVPKVCDRVIANAQHDRGIWMYRMREKPILTPEDVAGFVAHEAKLQGLACECRVTFRYGMTFQLFRLWER